MIRRRRGDRERIIGSRFTHGEGARGHKSPEYRAWQSMQARCYCRTNRVYACYGGRGIRVCLRWRRAFVNFLTDVGRRPAATHTLERKNNARGYYPNNVCWATRAEQSRNRRANRIVVIDGERMPLVDAAARRKLPYNTVLQRIRLLGWSPAEALSRPIRPIRKDAA